MLQELKKRLDTSKGSKKRPDEKESQLLRELAERKAALIRQFRPPEHEWLLFGLLLAALYSCLAWGWILLFSLGDYATIVPGDEWARAGFIPFIFLAFFYRGRTLGEEERHEHPDVWLVKVLILALFVRLVPYLSNPAALLHDASNWVSTPVTFFSLGFIINFVIALWVTSQAESNGRHVLTFFLRPEEVLAEKGGGAIGTTGWVNRAQGYKEMRGRLTLSGVLLGVCLALFTLLTLNGPVSFQQNVAIGLTVAYVLLMLLTLFLARYRYLRTSWQVKELPVPATMPRRWLIYGLALGLIVALIALILPHSANIQVGQANFDNFMQDLQRRQAPDIPPPPPKQLPPQQSPVGLPQWFVLLVLIVTVTLAVAGLLWLILRSGLLQNMRLHLRLPRFSAGQWLSSVAQTFKDLLAALRGLLRRGKEGPSERIETSGRSRGGWLRRFGRESEPGDPRERVRYHYRQTLRRAQRSGLARKPFQTPHEYATELQTRFERIERREDIAPSVDVEQLSGEYEEARFSPHPITPDQAEAAAEQSRRVQEALRQARKQGRKPRA